MRRPVGAEVLTERIDGPKPLYGVFLRRNSLSRLYLWARKSSARLLTSEGVWITARPSGSTWPESRPTTCLLTLSY